MSWLSDIGKSVEKAVSGAGKNLERNAQGYVQDLSRFARGDFNNFGNTVARNIFRTGVVTGGVGMFANPDDLKKITGETTSERYKREQKQKAQDQANAIEAAKQGEIDANVASLISGNISQQKAYNRSYLGSSEPKLNTLLTLMSK